MRWLKRSSPMVACGLSLSTAVWAQDHGMRFAIELEAGAVWQSRNDVRIPNDGRATQFSIVDLVGPGPWPALRAYLTWNIGARHALRGLAAPLRYTDSGVFADTVGFAGRNFIPGSPTQATYKFNSFRLTYRYRFLSNRHWRWWIGFTAKIRDARVALTQGSVAAEDTDVGFVPLLHVSGAYVLTDRWRITLDVDALAGGPGRAEDVATKVAYSVSERWILAAGYRTLEGGADVDAVFAFAWLHYAAVSALYRF